jgi:hypothetical protein
LGHGTSFDQPGTLFRIDNNNVKYTAKLFNNKEFEIHKGKFKVGKLKIYKEANIALLAQASLTKQMHEMNIDTDIQISGNAIFSKENYLTVDFRNTSKELIDDSAGDVVLAWFKEHPPKPNNTYYLVREAVVCSDIKIELSKNIVNSLGGDAKLEELANANADFKRNNYGEYSLESHETPPLRVCIKAEKIIVKSSGFAGNKTYGFAEVTVPIIIKKVAD